MNDEHPRDESPEDPAPLPQLRELSMEAQPSRDLWPGIAARITVRRRRGRNLFLAAAACTVLAFSAMVSLRLAEDPHHAVTKVPIAAPLEFAAMTLPRSDLRANRALVKANLRLTQAAEGEVRKAMRQSPDDPSLQRLLDSTREQKRELHELLLSERK